MCSFKDLKCLQVNFGMFICKNTLMCCKHAGDNSNGREGNVRQEDVYRLRKVEGVRSKTSL